MMAASGKALPAILLIRFDSLSSLLLRTDPAHLRRLDVETEAVEALTVTAEADGSE